MFLAAYQDQFDCLDMSDHFTVTTFFEKMRLDMYFIQEDVTVARYELANEIQTCSAHAYSKKMSWKLQYRLREDLRDLKGELKELEKENWELRFGGGEGVRFPSK
mgnify:CR=1 FL=1